MTFSVDIIFMSANVSNTLPLRFRKYYSKKGLAIKIVRESETIPGRFFIISLIFRRLMYCLTHVLPKHPLTIHATDTHIESVRFSRRLVRRFPFRCRQNPVYLIFMAKKSKMLCVPYRQYAPWNITWHGLSDIDSYTWHVHRGE